MKWSFMLSKSLKLTSQLMTLTALVGILGDGERPVASDVAD